jgi:hypothetical protein
MVQSRERCHSEEFRSAEVQEFRRNPVSLNYGCLPTERIRREGMSPVTVPGTSRLAYCAVSAVSLNSCTSALLGSCTPELLHFRTPQILPPAPMPKPAEQGRKISLARRRIEHHDGGHNAAFYYLNPVTADRGSDHPGSK